MKGIGGRVCVCARAMWDAPLLGHLAEVRALVPQQLLLLDPALCNTICVGVGGVLGPQPSVVSNGAGQAEHAVALGPGCLRGQVGLNAAGRTSEKSSTRLAAMVVVLVLLKCLCVLKAWGGFEGSESISTDRRGRPASGRRRLCAPPHAAIDKGPCPGYSLLGPPPPAAAAAASVGSRSGKRTSRPAERR